MSGQAKDGGVDICWNSAWGSSAPEYRTQLRRALCEKLISMGVQFDREQVMDLSKWPLAEGINISLSHCPEAGGWAITDWHQSVGFDLEVPKRVKAEVVARVSNPSEVSSAPSAAALWVAKEASFKALRGPRQPLLISQVQISNWKAGRDGEFDFDVSIDDRATDFSEGSGMAEVRASFEKLNGRVFQLEPELLAAYVYWA